MHVTVEGDADTHRAHNYVEVTKPVYMYSGRADLAQPEGMHQ